MTAQGEARPGPAGHRLPAKNLSARRCVFPVGRRENSTVQEEVSSPDRQGRVRGAASLRPMAFGVLAGIALTAALLTVLWWPRSEVVHRSHEPSTTTYADKSRHYLGLVREHTLSGRESYHLVIGRDPSLSYGHHVDVDADLGAGGVESTDWTTTGVRLRFTTGHSLFLPARFFTHGR